MRALLHASLADGGWSLRSRRRSARCQYCSCDLDGVKTYGAVHCKDEDQQEKRKVSCSIACSEHENEAADQHDGYRVEEEPETVLKSVTHEGVSQRPEDHEDVWRSCE